MNKKHLAIPQEDAQDVMLYLDRNHPELKYTEEWHPDKYFLIFKSSNDALKAGKALVKYGYYDKLRDITKLKGVM